jgi:ABC-type branched-subunit amino acid transport system ATPase component
VLNNVMTGSYGGEGQPCLSYLTSQARAEEIAIQRRSQELLRFVGLESKANDLASNLPGGQQRLVGLARALISSPG